MPQIEFQGQMHEFPDNFTQDQISGALKGFMVTSPTASHNSTPDTSTALRTERTNVSARTDYTSNEGVAEDGTAVEDFAFPELPTLNDKQRTFGENIGQIETGGLDNRFIRTKVRPDGKGKGSSAYGPYQITHGLLEGTMEVSPDLFDPVEQRAVQELMERQEVSLAIGGRDRKRYEKGGLKRGLANRWAKQYGFESTADFLDAFDYGGDLGLSDDGDFQTLYEGIGRKLLNKHLKDAGGDEVEAAGVWHGGPNWRKKNKSSTEQYIDKYNRLVPK